VHIKIIAKKNNLWKIKKRKKRKGKKDKKSNSTDGD
jgi:hypothetical protein